MTINKAGIMTITGPAHWASAIINGDYSGLTTEETMACQAWRKLQEEGGWQIVSMTTDEPRFTWNFRLYGGECAGGEVVDYQAIRV